MIFWLNKRVVVTGGAGFLGAAVTNKLNQAGCQAIVPRSKDYDLRDTQRIIRLYQEIRPEIHICSSMTEL